MFINFNQKKSYFIGNKVMDLKIVYLDHLFIEEKKMKLRRNLFVEIQDVQEDMERTPHFIRISKINTMD